MYVCIYIYKYIIIDKENIDMLTLLHSSTLTSKFQFKLISTLKYYQSEVVMNTDNPCKVSIN